MSRQKSVFKVLIRTGRLIALAVIISFGVAAPSSAQFFNFGGWTRSAPRSHGGWFGNFFRPFQPRPQPPRRVYHDYSRAPPPKKRDTVPERTVLVLGDGMADWLAYGLEQAYADEPEIGIIRKVKANTGLIRYQFKGDPADWPAAAKEILAGEKPDVIVVMLGLSDRIPIREAAEKKERKNAHSKSDDNGADNGLSPDESDNADASLAKTQRPANGIDPFHDERWIELYNKKIEAMIAAVKSKGVPVVWVGLPAIRGVKGAADMLFLDSLYRNAADKAGITYVDDWDGFVDDAGRFMLKGPDFQGQTRLLRSWDGVYFTSYGARKLALYVEHEIDRLMAARSAPFAVPNEQAMPEASAVPGQPAPRPLAGPVLPLVA
ncbi:MAG: SGNH/GDSL hydrolase family protein, partial [Bradyrhizobium sp.]